MIKKTRNCNIKINVLAIFKMNTEDVLADFKCALSIVKHFLIDPIPLTNCGHCICKNCLPNDKVNSIKCKICNTVTEQDFSKIQVSKPLKQALKLYYGDIFNIVENEFSAKLNELKSNNCSIAWYFHILPFLDDLKDRDECLDLKITFM